MLVTKIAGNQDVSFDGEERGRRGEGEERGRRWGEGTEGKKGWRREGDRRARQLIRVRLSAQERGCGGRAPAGTVANFNNRS